ncbi:hypothetical protein FPJ27_02430 [Burkholderia sp. MS455]|nr:hypothetical protein FPJ27_02430 [Burkholderia sp. MS455]
MRRDRVRRKCCGERIAPTANVERCKRAAAVISIDEIVRCPQCMRFGIAMLLCNAPCAANGRCAMRGRISISQNVGRAVRCVTVESGIRSRAGMLREHEGADTRVRPGRTTNTGAV